MKKNLKIVKQMWKDLSSDQKETAIVASLGCAIFPCMVYFVSTHIKPDVDSIERAFLYIFLPMILTMLMVGMCYAIYSIYFLILEISMMCKTQLVLRWETAKEKVNNND